MSPKKPGLDGGEIPDYQTVLNRCCRDADVLIIPEVERWVSLPDIRERKPQEEISDSTCPPPSPPILYVSYDWTDSGEAPVSVWCKFIYVEYALIHAVFLTLPTFPTITCLRIQDCCVSRDVVHVLATLLAEPSGAGIVELSLDGNPDIAEDVPILLRTGLKYLSLKRCCLNDEAVLLISHELTYDNDRDQRLLALNLAMNKIGDEGALALAAALRTNRTLISLSLHGNHITDVGAAGIADVLNRFALSKEEVTCRRRRVYERIVQRRSILDRFMEEWKARNEADGIRVKTSGEKLTKRTKSIEMTPLKRTTSSRDKRRAGSSTRMSSREKTAGGRRRSLEPGPAEMEEMMSQVEAEMSPDRHPFVTEVTPVDDEFFCNGSWRLGNINLAYNRLTEQSIDRFLSVVYHQEKTLPIPRTGLLRLVIQPGNSIPRGSPKIAELECLLKNRRDGPRRPLTPKK